MTSEQSELDSVDWLAFVARVKSDDPEARGELHRVFSKGIRFFLSRRLGLQQLELRIQETLTLLVEAIKMQDPREHEPLVGLVRTIVLKQIVAYSHVDLQNLDQLYPGASLVHGRHRDMKAIDLQKNDHIVTVLKSMSIDDQEALTRFYVQGQTQERICDEMGLSEMQFRLLKARAKASFETAGALSDVKG